MTRGIAIADVDGDGALDFAVGNQWEPSFIYRNRVASHGAFLGLRLLHPVGGEPGSAPRVEEGREPYGGKGTPALGASVKVRLPDGRQLVGQVDGGNGHSGKRSPELHFGLGRQEASARMDVEVAWRDGTGRVHRQSLKLTPGWYTVVLGAEGVTEASR